MLSAPQAHQVPAEGRTLQTQAVARLAVTLQGAVLPAAILPAVIRVQAAQGHQDIAAADSPEAEALQWVDAAVADSPVVAAADAS